MTAIALEPARTPRRWQAAISQFSPGTGVIALDPAAHARFPDTTERVWVREEIPVDGEPAPAASLDLAADWLPTAENVNALPEPLRRYVHDLETRSGPAGEVVTNALLRDHIRMVEADNERLRAAQAEPTPITEYPAHPFAVVVDRTYEGEGPTLAVWNGENYNFSDGDCFEREADGSLDGYDAEWLTHYQLERRLLAVSPAAAPAKAVDVAAAIEEAFTELARELGCVHNIDIPHNAGLFVPGQQAAQPTARAAILALFAHVRLGGLLMRPIPPDTLKALGLVKAPTAADKPGPAPATKEVAPTEDATAAEQIDLF